MGMTLDQLLEATGIDEMAGLGLKKVAAEKSPAVDFLKLAQRCREAATEVPVAVGDDAERDLISKTAAVAVISRTLHEIDEICGVSEKTAAAVSVDPIAFAQEALSKGHSPEDIAVFMKQANLFSNWGESLASMWHRNRGTAAITKGVRLKVPAQAFVDKGQHRWEQVLRDAGTSRNRDHQRTVVADLRRQFGDADGAALLSSSGAGASLKGVDGIKEMLAAAAAAEAKLHGPKHALSFKIGDTTIGLTQKQLNTYGKPAALVAGGAVVAKGGILGGNEKKKSGVVVINS